MQSAISNNVMPCQAALGHVAVFLVPSGVGTRGIVTLEGYGEWLSVPMIVGEWTGHGVHTCPKGGITSHPGSIK